MRRLYENPKLEIILLNKDEIKTQDVVKTSNLEADPTGDGERKESVEGTI